MLGFEPVLNIDESETIVDYSTISWQPYPVDPYSCYMCDHNYIHTYILLASSMSQIRQVVVVVVVFFTLTDRASTIPSTIRGCQSGTWSAGQKEIRGTSTKLQ